MPINWGPGWPTLKLEVGFPSLASGAALWNHALWNVGKWGTGRSWTDLSEFWRGTMTINRGRSRVTDSYPVATLSLGLDNYDGRFSPGNLDGPYVIDDQTQVLPSLPIQVTAEWNGVKYWLFYGYIDSWGDDLASRGFDQIATISAVDALSLLGAVDGLEQPIQGGGETSGLRIHRIADNAEWRLQRAIDVGNVTVQATTLAGNALTEAKLVADSEGGALWADPDGTLVFEDQFALITNARSTTPQVTFGTGAGEVNFEAAKKSFDRTLLFNTISYARAGGTVQTVVDTASRARYKVRSRSRRDLICQTDEQVLNLATLDLARWKDPEERIDSITFQPAGDPDVMWPHALGRRIRDRAIAKVRQASGVLLERNVFIEGVTHQISERRWTTTFPFSSATTYDEGWGTATEDALPYWFDMGMVDGEPAEGFRSEPDETTGTYYFVGGGHTDEWAACRYASSTVLDLPTGKYALTVGVMDPTFSSAGDRVVDLKLNGVTVRRDIDIVDEFGADTEATIGPYIAESIANAGIVCEMPATTDNGIWFWIKAEAVSDGTALSPEAGGTSTPSPLGSSHGSAIASGGSISVDLPSGITTGELLLLHVSGYDTLGLSTPSGWTLLEHDDTTGVDHSVFWRTADGSEGSTLSISLTDSSGASYQCLRISGADGFDTVTTTYDYGVASLDATVTTADTNRLIVACQATIDGVDPFTTDFTAGWDKVADDFGPFGYRQSAMATFPAEVADDYTVTATPGESGDTSVILVPVANDGGTGGGGGGSGGGFSVGKYLGVHHTISPPSLAMQYAVDLHTTMERVEFPWNGNGFNGPNLGPNDSMSTEQWLSFVASNHLTPLPLLNTYATLTGINLDEFAANVVTWCQAYAYGGWWWNQNGNGIYAPKAVIICNEPYGEWFKGNYGSGEPLAYSSLLKKCRAALDAAGLTQIGILGAAADGPPSWHWDWNQTITDDGGYDACAGVTVHPYGAVNPPYASPWDDFGFECVYREHERTGKPIWVDELGFDTNYGVVGGLFSQAQKNAAIVEVIDQLVGVEWIVYFGYFALRGFGSPYEAWGLLDGDGSAYGVFKSKAIAVGY